MYALS